MNNLCTIKDNTTSMVMNNNYEDESHTCILKCSIWINYELIIMIVTGYSL